MTYKKFLKKIKKIELSVDNKIDSLFAGNYRSAFLGRGIEFSDLRPYENGDDIRDIDWKTSAKEDKLFIKKYQESRDNNIFFILDISPVMKFSSVEGESKFENQLETFALLAFSAIRNGDRVGVALVSPEQTLIFPFRKGKNNIFKILIKALEMFNHQVKDIKKVDFKKSFGLIKKYLKRSSVVFWFSGVMPSMKEESALKDRLKSLMFRNDFIPVIFSDPEEENLTLRGNYDFQDLKSGSIDSFILDENLAEKYQEIYQKKKKEFLDFFRRYRREVIFINSSEKIFQELFNFFKKRQKHQF